MILTAPAKINLGLDILRKREDGYHEVRMIMQTISLFDTLEIERAEKAEIYLTSDAPQIPCDETNLIYKAARLLMDEFAVKEGVRIHLTKRIPEAAGLAGGSTDAAATLIGINDLFALGLSREDLMKRGVKIGADVPYCVMMGTALAEGIGEILTPIAANPSFYVLIGKPAVGVSTKEAYGNLKLNEIKIHPDIDGIAGLLIQGDTEGMAQKMENVFEPGIVKLHPVIREIEEIMEAEGAVKAVMSGSGPTVFGVFTSKDKLLQAEAVLRKSGKAAAVHAVQTYDPSVSR